MLGKCIFPSKICYPYIFLYANSKHRNLSYGKWKPQRSKELEKSFKDSLKLKTNMHV
jgi:hypothetical protein